MGDKMKDSNTYTRAPSNGKHVVTTVNASGKVVGKQAPKVVNNSAQGRHIPKKPR